MSTENGILFLFSAAFAVAGALGTILSRKPLRAAMGLLLHIISLAGLYISLHSQLLATVQVIVYAGAVVVLFVFVVMLIGPDAEGPPKGPGHVGRLIGGIAIGALMLTVASALFGMNAVGTPLLPETFGGVERFAAHMYKDAVIPFELVSLTLLVAIVGAIAIVRGKSTTTDNDAAAASVQGGEGAEA